MAERADRKRKVSASPEVSRVLIPLRMHVQIDLSALRSAETVTKTYRSAYVASEVTHSGAGGNTLTLGTITVGINASNTVITEIGDTEAFTALYLTEIASSTFSGGSTINWTSRKLEINQSQSTANVVSYGNVVVVHL